MNVWYVCSVSVLCGVTVCACIVCMYMCVCVCIHTGGEWSDLLFLTSDIVALIKQTHPLLFH